MAEVADDDDDDNNKLASLLKFTGCADVTQLTILIVCDDKPAFRKLSSVLVQMPRPFRIFIHWIPRLPFRFTCDKEFDYIVFMMSMSKKSSKINIEESLRFVDMNFFLGKSCLVVINSHVSLLCGCDIKDVLLLEKRYGIPRFHTYFEDKESVQHLAYRIMTQAEIAAGLKRKVVNTFCFKATLGNALEI